MDLITYLKNTNNEELYQKLKEIVTLYKERESKKALFILLNNEYNEFLIAKHKEENNKPKKNKKDGLLDKLTDMNPFLLFYLFIMVPPQILIVILIVVSFIFLRRLKIKKQNAIKANSSLFKDFIQDTKYEELCKAREQYHTKRKELESILLTLKKEELELINEFYGALKEYDELLDNLSTTLEEKQQLPQVENNETLDHSNIQLLRFTK